MSEMLRTRGSRVLILDSLPQFRSLSDSAIGFYTLLTSYSSSIPFALRLVSGPARQEEFGRNIESLAKWIEGAIQRFRAGGKNSRIIELHDTNHYVFIVDERFTRRGGRWSFEKCASSCSMNKGAYEWINHRDYGFLLISSNRRKLIFRLSHRCSMRCARRAPR